MFDMGWHEEFQEKLLEKGNLAFEEGNYQTAVEYYSRVNSLSRQAKGNLEEIANAYVDGKKQLPDEMLLDLADMLIEFPDLSYEKEEIAELAYEIYNSILDLPEGRKLWMTYFSDRVDFDEEH